MNPALQSGPDEQAVAVAFLTIVASAVLFFVSVVATGRVAARLAIPDVQDTDALLVTIYKSVAATGLMAVYLAAPALPLPLVVFTALVLGPVAIMKHRYAIELRTAAKLWSLVFLTEIAAGTVLMLGARWLGAYLDHQFQLPDFVGGAG